MSLFVCDGCNVIENTALAIHRQWHESARVSDEGGESGE